VAPFDVTARQQHREWVARMAAGDSDALRNLHGEFVALLHGVARRILADPEEVREVVQDTFVKAWTRAQTYREERGEVYAWLIFIARNHAIDRLRRSERRRELLTALEAEAPDPVPGAEAADRKDFLLRHLGNLTPVQRQALELAFFTGCSQLEIAAAMQTPIGNVKNHLRRGLLKLRQLVTRHD
jgi:RNA polymerase sigma-70 factor, ECF subfamily